MLNEVSLADSDGQIIEQFDVKGAKANKYFQSKKEVNFSVKKLKKGIYYVRIKMGQKLDNQRVVISK
ncbi:T9SS type A sorting domain-containing protein [Larkinella sp. VNQ87]|uniref:T9SS type A sorting domain-containing protein n=1 Tax=Larkinella sp. VNQ87 TaxID=3400921 RepID=UPI003C025739